MNLKNILLPYTLYQQDALTNKKTHLISKMNTLDQRFKVTKENFWKEWKRYIFMSFYDKVMLEHSLTLYMPHKESLCATLNFPWDRDTNTSASSIYTGAGVNQDWIWVFCSNQMWGTKQAFCQFVPFGWCKIARVANEWLWVLKTMTALR